MKTTGRAILTALISTPLRSMLYFAARNATKTESVSRFCATAIASSANSTTSGTDSLRNDNPGETNGATSANPAPSTVPVTATEVSAELTCAARDGVVGRYRTRLELSPSPLK